MKRERLWKVGLKIQASETTGAHISSFNYRSAIDIPDYQDCRRKDSETVSIARRAAARRLRASSSSTLKASVVIR